jgi:hypothetical protein
LGECDRYLLLREFFGDGDSIYYYDKSSGALAAISSTDNGSVTSCAAGVGGVPTQTSCPVSPGTWASATDRSDGAATGPCADDGGRGN